MKDSENKEEYLVHVCLQFQWNSIISNVQKIDKKMKKVAKKIRGLSHFLQNKNIQFDNNTDIFRKHTVTVSKKCASLWLTQIKEEKKMKGQKQMLL